MRSTRRQQRTETAADDEEHQIFDEDLANQTSAARTERGPERKLLCPAERARELKAPDVRASNGKEQPHRAHQHPKSLAVIRNHRLQKWNKKRQRLRAFRGIFFLETLPNGAKIGLPLRQGDAGFQSAEGIETGLISTALQLAQSKMA